MDNEQNLKNITTPVEIKSTGIEATSPTTTPYILNGEFYEILSQEGEGVTVRCRKCPGENIYKGSVKSTGNFHMHIKRKHSELLPRVHEMKLKSFTERKFKMPQRRQQPYNNNSGRKIIKNEKYQRKLSPEKANFDQNNIQMEPIDYRKNPTTTLLDNMIITQIHNPIHNNYHSNSYPIITNEQCNQNEYLFSTQSTLSQPPPAHQNSFEYVKEENVSVVRGVGDVNEEEHTTSFSDQQNYNHPNKIIMASSSNKSPNIISQHNSKHQQPLQIISTSPTMPLMTTAVNTAAIPGHDVLLRVENHLKGIEREMRLRNQIESNRIYLDLAKFKFLHPNFTLQN